MKKFHLIMIIALTAALLVISSSWLWLTRTESGARWALAMVPIDFQDIQGSFRGGLIIENLSTHSDQTTARVDQAELKLGVSLGFRPALNIARLRISGGEVILYAQSEPTPNPRPTSSPRETLQLPKLPLDINLHHFLAEQILLSVDDFEYPIERLQMSGHIKQDLQIDYADLQLPDLYVDAKGRLGLQAPHRLEATASARLNGPGLETSSIHIDVMGDLDALDLAARTEGLVDLTVVGTITQLLQGPQFSAELSGRLNPSLDFETPDHHMQLSASGSLQDIQIERLIIETLGGEITGDAQIPLGEDIEAHTMTAALNIASLDFTHLLPEWPAQAKLDGAVQIQLHNQILSLETFSIHAPPLGMTIAGGGTFNLDTHETDLDLEWSQASWPPILDTQRPLFSSDQGRLWLKGSLSDWQLRVEAVIDLLDDPKTQLQSQMRGRLDQDTHHVAVETLTLMGDSVGVLNMQGEISHDGRSPSGDLSFWLDSFNPQVLHTELIGLVSAEARFVFISPQHWNMDVPNLRGELRGQPLLGHGRLAIDNGQPQHGNFTVDLGENRLSWTSGQQDQAAHHDSTPWHIELSAPALSQLWPSLSGQLLVAATIDPLKKTAAFDAQLADASFKDIALSRADLSGHIDADQQLATSLELKIHALDLNPWERIDELDLQLNGDCLNHNLEMLGRGERGALLLSAQGRLNDCEPKQINAWSGALQTLELTNTIAGDWLLKQPMPMQIGKATQLGPGCLSDGTGRLCLHELALADQSAANVTVSDLPINLLLLPLNSAFLINSDLSGKLEAEWKTGQGLTHLAGKLEMGAGTVVTAEDEIELIEIMGVLVQLSPSDGGLRVDLNAALDESSRIQGVAHIHDFNAPLTAELNGDATLTIADIGILAAFVPEFDQIEGRLDGQVRVDGPLPTPWIQGQLNLNQGRLEHAPLGLSMTNIQLTLDAKQGQLNLTGALSAGAGQLSLEGRMQQRDQVWHGHLDLEGERLTLANINWLQIESSPRIQLAWQPDSINIDGDIQINRLRAGLPPGRADRIESSADVVIVQATNDALEPRNTGRSAPATPAAQRLNGRLGIDFGPAATVDMIGIQTRLDGQLALSWNGGASEPTPRGAIALVDGTYRAYGQNLQIRDSQVIFSGHRLQNPAISVEAVREVFGDPRVTVAGVRMRGQAQDPQVTLFTDPPTTDEKALAYLVTGADFDYAGGQAAVNIGVYLLPRLLVTYGFGLLETGNVLSGRYELSRRWGIRAASGERDTGVDLSYAIDR